MASSCCIENMPVLSESPAVSLLEGKQRTDLRQRATNEQEKIPDDTPDGEYEDNPEKRNDQKCEQLAGWTRKPWLPVYLLLAVVLGSCAFTTLRQSRDRVPPLLPDPVPPATCYRCDNYANLMIGKNINAQKDVVMINQFGGNVIGAGGVGSEFGTQAMGELCAERVNRSALADFQSGDDFCEENRYNGCFKMVTKSYRVAAGLGREQLVVTVVTRNCAEIPETISLGCQKIYGGAGMVRELCYCKGDYCNGMAKLEAPALIKFLLMATLIWFHNLIQFCA
ncbi:unnamed protein product [Dibothriocephalus latus]|uniref:DUF5746 domain-containing protein n=1 Tax=Dibothriocephalus latus TaxID=60516 RepID=A0A3P7L7Y5_DIBLA|nr:unnamed protein product [Dibothriocephalus latus]